MRSFLPTNPAPPHLLTHETPKYVCCKWLQVQFWPKIPVISTLHTLLSKPHLDNVYCNPSCNHLYMYSFSQFRVFKVQMPPRSWQSTIRTPRDCPSRRATYTSFFWLRKWPNPLEWEPLCKNLAVLMTTAWLEIEPENIYDHGMFTICFIFVCKSRK